MLYVLISKGFIKIHILCDFFTWENFYLNFIPDRHKRSDGGKTANTAL